MCRNRKFPTIVKLHIFAETQYFIIAFILTYLLNLGSSTFEYFNVSFPKGVFVFI